MEFSKTQKEIIKAIVDKKVKDLNSFYSHYFKDLQTQIIGDDIRGSRTSIGCPELPTFCTPLYAEGIILYENQIIKILDFVIVWKELEKIRLIYSYDFYEINEESEYKYYIPLYPDSERILKGKFNHAGYGLIKDYLAKAIISTDGLKKFTKEYKTFEEIKFIRSLNWTKFLAIIAIAGVFLSAYFSYQSNKLQIEKQNSPDTNKVLILNSVKKDTVKILGDTIKIK